LTLLCAPHVFISRGGYVAVPTPEDVFARHHGSIYRYLVRMTGRPDVADDVSQDVFVRVVRALRNGGAVGHERGWVFSIARNLLVDRVRSDHRQPPAADASPEPATQGTQALAFGLSEALAGLSEDDREVFLLKEVGGLSYEEIAAACSCTVEAVRSRLFRTRSSLRKTLSSSL
jgi:RNA polymerase sigma-70 factor (ECF subfamily)